MNNLEQPTIRISRIVLENFKSVEYGEIDMACGKAYVPMGTQSDILGLYGQNGSGKTSLIEAMSIFKYLLLGEDIPDEYADCIMRGKEESHLEFHLDFQYEHRAPDKVIYEVKLAVRNPASSNELDIVGTDGYNAGMDAVIERQQFLVVVKNEKIRVAGNFEGGSKLQPIIDTACGNPFGPASKHKYFFDNSDSSELSANKSLLEDYSQSFIFNKRSMNIFTKHNSDYVDVLKHMQNYARNYLYVVDTKSSGLINLNSILPIIVRNGKLGNSTNQDRINLPTRKSFRVTDSQYNGLKEVMCNINVVLCKIIPGLNIDLRDLGPATLANGMAGKYVELISVRGDIEMPLRYESDGVKKIISVLQLFIEAYNDKSMTIAIDEFDAGIFEYLLGELLEIFEESGQGQLIFTSHNLRPLEVLDKDYICFTTTNAQNRYIRLDNIKPSNNLRNVYFRDIELGGNDEELYSQEKKYKVVQALRKAGNIIDG